MTGRAGRPGGGPGLRGPSRRSGTSADPAGARHTGRPGGPRCFPAASRRRECRRSRLHQRPRSGKDLWAAQGERSERPAAGPDRLTAQTDQAGNGTNRRTGATTAVPRQSRHAPEELAQEPGDRRHRSASIAIKARSAGVFVPSNRVGLPPNRARSARCDIEARQAGRPMMSRCVRARCRGGPLLASGSRWSSLDCAGVPRVEGLRTCWPERLELVPPGARARSGGGSGAFAGWW